MDTPENIAHWRNQLFSSILSVVLIMGGLTAIPSIIHFSAIKFWPMVIVDVGALGWAGAIWWLKQAPFHLRVLNFLAVMLMVGISLILVVGPVSQIYLFAAPVLAAVLLGMRPALCTLAVSGLIIFIFTYWGYAQVRAEALLLPHLQGSLLLTLNFLFIGTIITVPCSFLLQRLAKSLDSLQVGKDKLHSLNAELRLTAAAVARLNDIVVMAKVADVPGGKQPIVFVNDAFERRTGYQRAEVLGRNWDMLLGPDTGSAEAARVVRAVSNTEAVTAELLYHTKVGEPYWVEIELMPFADEGGKNTHWVAVGRDVTERKKSEQHIHSLAFYDVLTGLPNRRLLMDRIDSLLASRQQRGAFGAMLFVDLDHFKYINDARGHVTGDALLRGAAARLSSLAGKDDTVARIGGDEFVVLLAQLGQDHARASAAALARAEQVRDALTETFEIEGQHYNSSASIGIALLPRPGQTAHDLLREADTAMYRAKVGGRNRIALFEETMQADVEQRLTLQRDLAGALDKGELAMHMQLQVDRNGAPAGAELLMRWRRADGSEIPPEQFIPVAEECGLIIPLGLWALREACKGLLRLAQAGYTMPLSVNVSPSQFRQPDFVEQVRAALEETGAPANQLIFEVTEGLLIANLDDTIARMHQLAALGIRLSIDDFGTGYSSLAYLKRMPLYELKIDRSFIRDTPGDANGAAIVQSILAMASHLGLRAVAEGVETREQAAFLAANGTPDMQGYLFARPMPLTELITLLDKSSVETSVEAA